MKNLVIVKKKDYIDADNSEEQNYERNSGDLLNNNSNQDKNHSVII